MAEEREDGFLTNASHGWVCMYEWIGFRLHHSEPEYAVLNHWLKPGTESKVPPFATHLVGVAGFVVNKEKEVLLVKEGSKVRFPACLLPDLENWHDDT